MVIARRYLIQEGHKKEFNPFEKSNLKIGWLLRKYDCCPRKETLHLFWFKASCF